MNSQAPIPRASATELPGAVVDQVAAARRITVFTGAGMSAESGVPTFRDAQTGLWSQFEPEQLATPEAWQRDRDLVWAWYLWRTRLIRQTQPNPGHFAITDLGADREVSVVTQNVDDLHERAGNTVISHLHGSLFAARCERCSLPYELDEEYLASATAEEDRRTPPSCPACGAAVRPGVVWFGEMLPTAEWDRAEAEFGATELVIVVGTSGVVYPAASLPGLALARGVPVIEFNPAESGLSASATTSLRMSAADGLSALVRVLE